MHSEAVLAYVGLERDPERLAFVIRESARVVSSAFEGARLPDGPWASSLDQSRAGARRRRPRDQPGTRPGAPLPHAWVEDAHLGARRALLDLARHGKFLLIAGEDGAQWCEAARQTAADSGVPLRAVRGGHVESDYRGVRCAWIRHPQISKVGAVLVRPDNVVGWRSATLAAQLAAELRNALRQILGFQRVTYPPHH